MNILITGSSGFIGKNLTKTLSSKNYSQIIGCDVIEPEGYFQKEFQFENFEFVNASFLSDTHNYAHPTQLDAIVHLARTIKPGPQSKNFSKDIEENVLGTIQFFKYWAQNGLKKFVLISSGGTVYGNENGTGEYLETDYCKPISYYGLASLMTENYLKILSKEHNVDLVILRLSNPYGPFQSLKRKQGLINTIIEKAVAGEVLEVWGDGSTVRDYIFIDDVAEAIHNALQYQGKEKIFNIGTGIGRSVSSVLEHIDEIIDEDLKITYKSAQKNAVDKNILNISKAKDELHWVPKSDWKNSLLSTYSYYKKATTRIF